MQNRRAIAEGAARLTAAGIPTDEARREARILVREATGMTNEDLYAYPERELTDEARERWESLVARRERREPLAYILGYREFYGLTFKVTPAVLIPRPETELLVEITLDRLKDLPNPVIVDVGTGSGCIAVALAVHRPDAILYATDISPDALTIAGENAERHGTDLHLREGDLLTPFEETGIRFHAIVSNPPYIAPVEIAALEPEVRDWEPALALGTNANPFAVYGSLAAQSLSLLNPGGLLAAEVGQGQADSVAQIWSAHGINRVTVYPDYAGIGRVVVGFRP